MLKIISYGLLVLCFCGGLLAQNDTTSMTQRTWLEGGTRAQRVSSPPLPYPETQSTDILWEKRIWRDIDTRQKINLVFRAPTNNLFELVHAGIKTGDIQAYRPTDDHFSEHFAASDIEAQFNQTDTIMVRDPKTGEYYSQVITNQFDPERVQRWRLQEIWYFDARYSKLRVRIVGLAPIIDRYDENGEMLRYSTPMYWINYTEARPWLAQHAVFNPGNDKSVLSWDDLFQMRRFHGYVYRESDLLGRRLQDYTAGTELLQKSRQIYEAIFNREMDHWSY